MLLLRGATPSLLAVATHCFVSIHAPLARSNYSNHHPGSIVIVSIHAPLARSNLVLRMLVSVPMFQYMLLLRGATRNWRRVRTLTCFNTCSSCEEQLDSRRRYRQEYCFNTCSSCEEQQPIRSGLRIITAVSIHAPLARSNSLPPAPRISPFCFNTCSSCEEQPVVRP